MSTTKRLETSQLNGNARYPINYMRFMASISHCANNTVQERYAAAGDRNKPASTSVWPGVTSG